LDITVFCGKFVAETLKMRKNTTHSLQQIAAALGPAELEATAAFIAGFNRKYGEYEPKTLKLFNFILDNTKAPDFSDQMVKAHLFPEMDEGTFTKLVARLKEKIFESLQLEVNLSRGNSHAPSWLAKQRGKKALIAAEILSIKGLRAEADELLRKVLRDGQKFELYELAGAASRQLYIHVCAQLGSEKGEDLRQQSEFYNKLACIERQVDLLFYQIGFKRENPYQGEASFRHLASEIKRLSTDLQGLTAPGIEYLLSHLKISYWEGVGAFDNQLAEAQKVRELLSNNPGISSALRQTNIALQAMTAALHLRDFASALGFGQEARAFTSLSTYNGRKVATYLAVVLTQNRQYEQAKDILHQILAQPLLKEQELEYATYLMAYLDFLQGLYSSAKSRLKSISLLRRQKQQDWALGIEVFELQLRIELGQYDVAEDLIANLQRRILRQGEKEKPSQRLFTLVRLLHALSTESFQFKPFALKNAKVITMLQNSRPGYRWDPFGPELIPFETWLGQHSGIALAGSVYAEPNQEDWVEVLL
jgi:hypothetical protein